MHADEQDTNYSGFSTAQVIVHEYQISKSGAAQPQLDNTTSRTPLFQTGSKLAREAVCDIGWKNTEGVDHKLTLKPNACFIWAQKLPQLVIQDSLVNRLQTLKGWGEPISQDEIVKLSELDEFEHDVNNSVAEPDAAAQPRKKRRLFSGSLHKVIEQPHFYSSTWKTPTMLGQTVGVPTYKKTKSVSVPPYGSDFTSSLRPLSAYSRTAWIIPVRGILPWSACTPAVVLDDGEDGVGKEGALIQWTKGALGEFWRFLLGVRAAGKVGRVGISFHVARAREREGSLGLSTEGINELQVWSLPLSSVDHVKVYHEARNAMSVRNVLDAWAYGSPSGQKIRLLKGSRFVLVDERGRGCLVS